MDSQTAQTIAILLAVVFMLGLYGGVKLNQKVNRPKPLAKEDRLALEEAAQSDKPIVASYAKRQLAMHQAAVREDVAESGPALA